MYCIKCGEQINENSKFCPKCGTCQDGITINESIEGKRGNNQILKTIIEDGKRIFLKLLSKTPFSAFDESSNTYVSGIILGIYMLLFGVVMNNNIIQIVNQIISYITKEMNSKYGAYIRVPNLEISYMGDLIVPFFLVAVVGIIFDVVATYIILFVRKKKQSMKLIIGHIAVSYLPLVVGLLLNLILGFIFVPIALAIYISCLVMHLIFLYKGISRLIDVEREAVWEYTIYIFVIMAILSFIVFGAIEGGVEMIFDALEQNINSILGDAFGGAFDEAFGDIFDMFGW